MFKFSTKKIVRAGLVAGLYAVLTFATLSFSSGFIQLRVAEALCLLPIFLPEAIIGLFIGCALSNLVAGCVIYDIIFGSIITLIAGILTRVCTKPIKRFYLKVIVGGLFPVALNALLLPVIWYFAYGELEMLYILQAVSLLISQSLSVYLLGAPLCYGVKKLFEKTQIENIEE